jgi:hypothetical protein
VFAGESLVQEEEEKVRFGVCPVRDAIPLWEAPLAALARWFRCRCFSPYKVNNHRLSTVASSLLYNLYLQHIMTSSLASSVTSLQSSLQLLDNSITTLDSGVNDFPRLCKVLQTTRVRHIEFRRILNLRL